MAYHVVKTLNNGYRCCCHASWEENLSFENLDEAIKEVPLVSFRHKDGNYELESIVVQDESGKIIAHGQLEWAHQREFKYTHQIWHGKVLETQFEQIKGGNPGESWNELLKRLNTPKGT